MDHIHPDKEINTITARNEALLNQSGQVIWFTGLSGSGKTTIAKALYQELTRQGYLATILDGDNLRHGLNKGLGFNEEDRKENIRRVAHVAKLMADAGLIVLASFITPTEEMRAMTVDIIGEDKYSLVYVNTSLETCMQRDIKGLYKKAMAGEIENLTGIGSPFEEPEVCTMEVDTEEVGIGEVVDSIIELLI